MKYAVQSIRMLLFMTILTGLAYPFATTILAKTLFRAKAEGSLITRNGQVIGSELIAQKFESAKYFWPRPSAGDFATVPSAASNFGQESADLLKQVEERGKKLRAAHPSQTTANILPPQDLLFASGSGLDPHITPAAAEYQAERVAQARGMPLDELKKVIKEFTEQRDLGFLGEPRVNVVKLNLALDNQGHGSR